MLKNIKLLVQYIHISFVYFITNNFILNPKSRARFYNLFYPKIFIGESSSIRKDVYFYNGSQLNGSLFIGKNTFCNDQCFIDFSSKVTIGNNVAIGMRVLVLSSTHKISNPIRCGELRNKETIICDNCWIGAGAVIYPGVTINEGAVVAAGEVVYSDIPKNKILKHGILTDINLKGCEK